MSNQKTSRRYYKFFVLEDRVLLSGEGPDGADGYAEADTDLAAFLLQQLAAAEGQAIDPSTQSTQTTNSANSDSTSEALTEKDAEPTIEDTLGQANIAPVIEDAYKDQLQSGLEHVEQLFVEYSDLIGNDHAAPNSSDAEPADDQTRSEIAFVDSGVADYETIIANLDANVEVIILDLEQDGLLQITQALAGRSEIDALHIFSHGVDGGIQVGATWINDFSIQWQSDIVASWSLALSANADLLLYGCNIASTTDGQSFLKELAILTGADVAASSDETGHATLGGDWNLEYSTGSIDAETAVDADGMDDWNDLLAITANGTATSTQSASANSLSWSHTVASGSDRVLYVTLAIDGLGAGVNSVTYGGVNLTQVGRTSGNHAVEIWRLVNPSVGTANVIVSLGGTTAVKGGAVTYNGVDQATPNGTYASATGTGTTATVNVSSATGKLVLDITNWDNNPTGYTIGANQSSVWSLTNTDHRGVTTTENGAATVTMSSTVSASNQWEMGAVSINASPNTAPVLADTSLAFSTDEDSGVPTGAVGSLISSFTGGITDADGGVKGIAITAANQTNGTWYYTTNSGSNWTALGTVDSTSSLLLADNANTRLYFAPSAEYSGTIASGLTIRAWDQSTGTAGTKVSTSSNGGSTAFSSATDVIALTVVAVNDAPNVVDDSYVTTSGATIPINLFANDSDVESGTLSIIDITAPDSGTLTQTGAGTFDYTTGAFGANSFQYRVDDGQYGLSRYYGLNGDGIDSVGGSNATAINGATVVDGQFGTAYSFDETNDHITLADYNYGSQFSLSFDFKIDDNTGSLFQYIYSHGTVTTANSLNIYLAEATHGTYNNQLFTNIQDGNDAAYAQELNVNIASMIGDGQWHNYTLTVDSVNGTRVFLDGTLSASQASRGADGLNAAGEVYLGARNDLESARLYGGSLDTVRMFNRSLTTQEVADQASFTKLVGDASINLSNVVTVTTTSDTSNGTTTSITNLNSNNGGDGISLREAITAANNTAGVDTISFNIAGAGSQTISLSSALPSITGTTILDAWTQHSFSGTPRIVIDANGATGDGFQLTSTADSSTIRGFVLRDFVGDGIQIDSGSTGSTIEGNYIGSFGAAGTDQGVNEQNTGYGIHLLGSGNTIGGTTVQSRNVIGGNQLSGVYINGAGATNNTLLGNYIGVDATGAVVVANDYGINIGDASGSVIGDGTAGGRNVISGNTNQGILLWNADSTTIQGNHVGTNASGTDDLNGLAQEGAKSGIVVGGGTINVLIGGTTAGQGNVISGNNWYGIEFWSGTTDSYVYGNYIGTDATGLLDLGNSIGGVTMWGSGTGIVVGGGTAAHRNVISGNDWVGVSVGNAAAATSIQGNYIGLGVDGSTIIGNVAGVVIEGGSAGSTIGTNWDGSNDSGEGNVISGNQFGIMIQDSGTSGTLVWGNYIGTDATGLLDRGNTSDGIIIQNGATGTQVGGTSTKRNIIAGNDGDGIQIDGETTDGNFIQNNYIGLGSDGLTVIGNSAVGINITGGADDTTIGGLGLGNAIVGSGYNGIEINGASSGTIIQGNTIGINAAGTVIAGNQYHGIQLTNGVSNTTIGGITAGQGNTITANGVGGTYVNGINLWSTGIGNSIVGNALYGNAGIGIDVDSAGVTANDNLDGDTGSNNQQNFPIISSTSVNGTGTTVTVSGSINTLASLTGVVLHFYATPSTGDISRRDGKKYLGSTTVNTDASGNATFTNASLTGYSGTVAIGELITATATYASSTSELSSSVMSTSSSGNIAPENLHANVTSDGGLQINHDGGNDAVLFADDGGAVFGVRSQMTIETQLSFTNGAGDMTLLSYGVGSTNFGNDVNMRLMGDGSFRFYINGSFAVANTFNYSSLADGNVHSLAVTWNNAAGDWQVFVDGTLRDSGTGLQTGVTVQGGGTLTLGNDQDIQGGSFDPNQKFSGTLYDMRVFSDVRTASEIAASYHSDLAYTEPSLLANWKFNDLSPNGVVTDTVAGNNLTVQHATGAGFIASNPSLTLRITENASNGTTVGGVYGLDIDREARITQLLAADPTLRYSAETGKFYKLVSTYDTWANSQSTAIATTLGGVSGQLLTVSSAAENAIARTFASQVGDNVWLGVSDQITEGAFQTYTGNTAGNVIWQGTGTGYNINGEYTNWDSGEPSDSGGNEDYADLSATTGRWNDASSAQVRRSIIEWNADDVLDTTNALAYSIQSQTVTGAFTINADTGEITVANGSLLDYETNATHTIIVRVSDGTATYDEAFTISLQNMPFEVQQSIPLATQSVDEDGTLTFSSGNGNAITVTDENAGTNSPFQIYLQVSNGTLTLSQTTGLLIPGGANGSSFMTIQGTESDINAALQGMTYTPTGNYNGSDTLVVTTSMVADLHGHYTFEDGDATDQSVGISQNGTLVGDATTVFDPERGEVLSLDGDRDFVSVASTFSNPANATLAAWVNLNPGAPSGEVISIGNVFVLRADDVGNGTQASFWDGSNWQYTNSGVSIAGTGWRHVAISFDDVASTQSLFIDGQLVATTNYTASINYGASTGVTTIGAHANVGFGGYDFNGLIDDARVYTRALSADEIAALAADQTEVTGNVAITVNAVNDAPTNAGSIPATFTVTEDVLGNLDLSAIDLSDVDHNSGLLTLTLSADAGGFFYATSSGGVTVALSGSDYVSFTGTLVDLNAYLEVTTNIQYLHPTANLSGTAADIVYVSISDNGNTGSGGALSANLGAVQIDITSVNDAPVLDNSSFMSLTTITEDNTNNSGNTVASIIASAGGDRIIDADAGAVEGIAITSISGTNGTWQYNTGSGWTDVDTVSTASALLLRATDSLRFTPNGISGDTGTVLFHAWDQTSGTFGTKVDASVTGGTTAFSTQVEVAVISVTSVNDAPALTANSFAISEAGFLTLTTAHINATDVDNASSSLVLTPSNVLGGRFNRTSNPGAAVTSFTLAEVTAGDIQFLHDGGDITPSYDITVSDGSATTGPSAGNITYTSVNDQPYLDANGIGPSTVVNTTTTGDQLAPSTVTLSGGNYVTAWESGTDIFAQVYNASGVPVGGELQLDDTAAATDISLISTNSGGFAAAWSNGTEVHVRAFDANGTPLTGSSTAITFAGGASRTSPTLVQLTNGNYVLAYYGATGVDASNGTAAAQILDASFNKVGSELIVPDVETGLQNDPFVRALSGGGFVVSFTDNVGRDGDGRGNYAQFYTSGGIRIGGNILVAQSTAGAQRSEWITELANGNVLFTYRDSVADGSFFGVMGRVFDSSGTAVTNEFLVNQSTAGRQDHSSSVAFSDGSFAILWNSYGANGDKDIFIRRFAADGTPLSHEMLVNTVAIGNNQQERMTLVAGNRVAITWQDSEADGDGFGIYTRQLDFNPHHVTYTENAAGVVLHDGINLVDFDDTHLETAVVEISGGYVNGQDQLLFTNTANISGSWDANTGRLTLSGSATVAEYQSALRSITYQNSSDNPVTTTRTIAWTVNDGDVSSLQRFSTVDVASENDAPVLDNTGTMELTSTTEDQINNSGQTVASIIASAGGDRITDPDDAVAEGIAITSLSSGNGTWQFTTNGFLWADVGVVSESSALLLRSTDLIRFNPNGQNATTASFDFRAWDQTSGTVGSKVDVNTNGGNTAFSSASETASITVTDINDEQVLATNTGATFSENSTSNTISTAMLATTDVDHTASQLTYTITTYSTTGNLYRNGVLLSIGGTFTQADIDSNLVTYSHNGAEVFSDSFSFSVDDGAGSVSTGTFNITLNPVNDQAVTITSDGGGASANFTQNETIAYVTQVTVSDGDLPSDTFTYSIIGGPDQNEFTIDNSGTLTFVAAPDFENPTDSDSNNVYTIIVQVSDGVHTDNQIITVTIVDVQSSTLTVTTTADVDDTALGASYTIEQLYAIGGGSDGHVSLREAIIAANNTLGPDTIGFAILDTDAGYTGTAGVDAYWQISLNAALPTITESVVLDGLTQTAFSGNVNPGTLGADSGVGSGSQNIFSIDRPEIAIVGASGFAGIVVSTDDVTIQGFSMYGFSSSAAILLNDGTQNVSIQSNILGSGPTSISDPGAALNNLQNVQSLGADNGWLTNNILAYSQATGFYASNASDYWYILSNHFINSGYNYSNGDAIAINASVGGLIDGNIITGSSTQAIILSGSTSGVTISNNTISGNAVGPITGSLSQYDAIALRSGTNNITISQNIIADNYGAGITVNNGAYAVEITQNSFSGNGTVLSRQGAAASGIVGIDLQTSGDNLNFGTAPYYSANDVGDADTGGNSLQNFPVFSSTSSTGSQLNVSGSFNSIASRTYRIEFYLSDAYANGHGQGATYLGSVNVTTDGSGNATFSETLTASIPTGMQVTATATDLTTLETSEFSQQFAINDAPIESSIEGTPLAYTENQTATAITSTLTLADEDDTHIESAVISITGNYANGQDLLAFANTANITSVWNSGSGTLTLTGADTVANYQAALRSVTYANTSNSPSTATRTVSFTINDGEENSNTMTRDITVTAVNDAPVVDFNYGTFLSSITEDQFDNAGQTVASVLASSGHDIVTDADSGAVEGIAIISTSAVQGTWQYSLDGGTNWLDVGSVTNSTALLLRATDWVRFNPDAQQGGSSNFGFHAWDQTSGDSAGDRVNITATGGSTAFSSFTETAQIAVSNTNDAPTISDASVVSLTGTDEDTTSSPNNVSNMLTGASWGDVDGSPLSGIAITGLTGNGTWEFSTGGAWTTISGVTPSNSLLLGSTAQVRYIPDGENGETAQLTFKAWDQTSGTPSTSGTPRFADSGTGGGTTAYSTTEATAQVVVTSINDAISAGSDTATAVEAGGVANGTAGTNPTGNVLGNDSDVDTSDTMTVTGVAAGVQASAAGSVNTTVTGTYGSITIADDGTYTYTVDNNNGAVQALRNSGDTLADTFTYTVTDGALASVSTQIVVTIQGQNDAPVAVADTEIAVETSGVANGTAGVNPTGNVLTNDTDVDSGDTQTVIGVIAGVHASASGSVNTPVAGTYGSIIIADDGNYTYTVDSDNAAVQSLRNSSDTLTDIFTYTMQDAGGLDNTAQISITIEGANDEQVLATTAGATVDEGSTGNVISTAMLQTTDVDDTSGNLIYTLDSAPTNGLLRVNGTALLVGQTFTQADIDAGLVTYDHYDSETNSDDFSFSVDDGEGSSSGGTFYMTITSVNDNAPTITSNGAGVTASINIAENTTAVTTVTASDSDLPAQTVTYSIVGGADSSLFTIDTSTGILAFVSGRNREVHSDSDLNGMYEVVVQASDGTLNDSQTISVTITDIDEFNVTVPTDVDSATNEVDENATIGTVVGVQASAADADATNNTVTFSLTSNPDGLFQIDAISGIVTTAAAIDRETHGATRSITVQATSSDGSIAVETFNITINDLDEFNVTVPTDIDNATNEVDENATIGTAVGVQASAADLDSTNNTVTFSLTSNPDGLFQIDAISGIVTTAAAIDRETHGATRSITVQATSSDGSTATETFNIAINDLDEFDVTLPVDTDGAIDWVLENSADGSVVGVLISAVDNDATNNAVTYGLIDDAGGRFTIDSTTGIVTVADGSLLDRETSSSHGITVQATGVDGSTSQIVVMILLGDVNDNSPVIDSGQVLTIVENSVIGTNVGYVLASDGDLNTSFENWQIVGGNAGGEFIIDAATGQLQLAIVGPDFESQMLYSLQIQTSDGTFTSASEWISILVIDANESPEAQDDSYSTIVAEAIRLDAPNPLANDTDVDGDTLSIVIVTGPVNGVLTIDPDGTLRYQPNSGYFGTETITYRASDGSLLSDLATITIDVQTIGGGGSGGTSSGDDGNTNNGDADSGSGDEGSESGSSDTGAVDTGQDIVGDGSAGNPFNSQSAGSGSTEQQSDEPNHEERGFGINLRTQDSIEQQSAYETSARGLSAAAITFDDARTAVQTLQQILLVDMQQAIDWSQWDQLVQDSERDGFGWDVNIGAVGVTAGLVSIGYVLWAIRGGLLLATVYGGLPAWRMIDPATLLTAYRGSHVNGKDRVEDMLG